jgi:MFS-type transporter involved in bile tolerance (Atg22 family)
MKKTNNPMKVLLVAFIVAAAVALIVTALESVIGSDKVFFGAICLIPVTFVWCLVTGERQRDKAHHTQCVCGACTSYREMKSPK